MCVVIGILAGFAGRKTQILKAGCIVLCITVNSTLWRQFHTSVPTFRRFQVRKGAIIV